MDNKNPTQFNQKIPTPPAPASSFQKSLESSDSPSFLREAPKPSMDRRSFVNPLTPPTPPPPMPIPPMPPPAPSPLRPLPTKPIPAGPSPEKAVRKPLTPTAEASLRTMRRDIEMLKKGERPSKMAVPPRDLPTAEPDGQKPIPVPTPAPAAPPEMGVLPSRADLKTGVSREATKEAFREAMKEVEGIRKEFEEERKETAPLQEKPFRPLPRKPIKPGEEMFATAPPPKRSKKGLFAGLIIIAIILAGAGGFLYWWNFMRQPAGHYECLENACTLVEGKGEDQCQTDQDCMPSEPTKPDSLVPAQKTEIIEIKMAEGDNLLTIVEAKHLIDFNDGLNKITFTGEEAELRRILIKLKGDKEVKYASLKEAMLLINRGKLGIPLQLMESFSDDYTLFIYQPEDGGKEFSECQNAGITAASCYDSRLGIAIKLSDKEEAVKELADWEETMARDIRNLILAEVDYEEMEKFEPSSVPEYQGADFIRYINLPISSITIDYGLRGNLLIIGTSRNSLKAALDAVANQ